MVKEEALASVLDLTVHEKTSHNSYECESTDVKIEDNIY